MQTHTFSQMFNTAYEEQCVSRGGVFEWFKRFKEGRESGRPSDDNRSERPVLARSDDQMDRVKEKDPFRSQIDHQRTFYRSGYCIRNCTENLNQ